MNLDQFKKNINWASVRRMALYLAVALLGVLLWDAWNKDHPTSRQVTPAVSNTENNTGNFVPPSFAPSTTSSPSIPAGPTISPPGPSQNFNTQVEGVSVNTNVLSVNIDPQGNLTDARLLKYNESISDKVPMPILESSPDSLYISQSGIKAANASQIEPIHYTSSQNQYSLPNGQNTLNVQLTGKTASGLEVIKNFVFERDKYHIQEIYQLKNQGSNPWSGSIYQQIVRKNVPPRGDQHSRSFNGAAISSSDKPYQKIPFKKLNEMQLNQNVTGGWIAMQQPYFLTAWIPSSTQFNHYYSSVNNDVYTLGYIGQQITIPPSGETTQKSTFYVGPEIPDNLKNLGKGLDLTIDYGWLWMFSKAIFWVMDHVHSVVKNWGWSIVITTLIIKLLFYKLSEKSYQSMAKMRDIQPRLQALKERYGDDKQGLSKATMEFYKKEKINPLGGCLPTIIQIPVFIALYYVLIESVQLRQAPFLWIKDLSVHDPYYILPILMGLSMFLQQRLSPPPPDPTQAKMMMFLPVIFTIFFLSFPAGLVLYWLVNSCASVFQQWLVMKTYKAPTKFTKKKKFKNKSMIKTTEK